MGPGIALTIVFVTAIVTIGVVLKTLISLRYGRSDARDRLGTMREVQLLSNENAGLKGQVTRLEERIAVLERIATDPAERTAREIEQLR
jgi:hypothetical protein